MTTPPPPGRHERRGRHELPIEVFVVRDATGAVLYEWDDVEDVPATRGRWCLQHDSSMDYEVCQAVRLMRDAGRSTFIACAPTDISIEVRPRSAVVSPVSLGRIG